MESEENLLWLQNWYQANTSYFEKNEQGIILTTIDNPGWHLRINLYGSELAERAFKNTQENIDDFNWFSCSLKKGIFEGFCGPCNLNILLNIFKKWVENVVA